MNWAASAIWLSGLRLGDRNNKLIIPKKLCHRSRSIKFSVYSAFPRLSRRACSPRRSQTIIHLSGVYLSSSKQKFINRLLFLDGARSEMKRRGKWKSHGVVSQRLMCRCGSLRNGNKENDFEPNRRFINKHLSAQSTMKKKCLFRHVVRVSVTNIGIAKETYGIFYLWKFLLTSKLIDKALRRMARKPGRVGEASVRHEMARISAINCLEGVSIDRAPC